MGPDARHGAGKQRRARGLLKRMQVGSAALPPSGNRIGWVHDVK